MGKNLLVILSAIFFLYGCESATKIDVVSGSTTSVVTNNNNDTATKNDVPSPINSSTGVSSTPTVSAEEIINQKFAKIGSSVYFDFDKSTLDPISQDILSNQAKFLKSYPSTKIIIEGHCDERGTREYNLALGDRRAVAVRDFLAASGINESRIKIISYGKEKPIVGGSNPTSWAINRRAVSVLAQ